MQKRISLILIGPASSLCLRSWPLCPTGLISEEESASSACLHAAMGRESLTNVSTEESYQPISEKWDTRGRPLFLLAIWIVNMWDVLCHWAVPSPNSRCKRLGTSAPTFSLGALTCYFFRQLGEAHKMWHRFPMNFPVTTKYPSKTVVWYMERVVLNNFGLILKGAILKYPTPASPNESNHSQSR